MIILTIYAVFVCAVHVVLSTKVVARTSCTKDTSQLWNTRDIGESLLVWWNSITSVIAEEGETGPTLLLFDRSVSRYYEKYSGLWLPDRADGLLTLTRHDLSNLTGLTWQEGGPERVHWQDPQPERSKGFLYGFPDSQGQFTGDEILYIKPDMETAIFGRFINDTLEKGVEATITGERCSNGIKELRFETKDTEIAWAQGNSNKNDADDKLDHLRHTSSSRANSGEGEQTLAQDTAFPETKTEVFIKTTCSTSSEKWNTRKVQENLQIWWNSVKKSPEFSMGYGPSVHINISESGTYHLNGWPSKENRLRTITSQSSSTSLPAGLTWVELDKLFPSGFLYGVPDTQGLFTGDDMVYIYPDFETAIYGRFINGTLEKGVEAKITGERCSNGIKELKFKLKNVEDVWSLDITNSTYIGLYPTRTDPKERKSVYFGASSLPGGGEGAFAKRNFLPGDLVSYYHGTRFLVDGSRFVSTSAEALFDVNSYLINNVAPERWNVDKNLSVDIPRKYRSATEYRTTLCHKVNHKIKGANVVYSPILHPVFGAIVCTRAISPILRGEELFVNYNYMYNELLPGWYLQSYRDAGIEKFKSFQ